MASKLFENERRQQRLQKQQREGTDNNIDYKSYHTSPRYFEPAEQNNKEREYNASAYSVPHNRYPHARELMENYHHKPLLNRQDTTKENEEQEEEVIVDTDAEANMIDIYQNRETQNESLNVPEDLSKTGKKRNGSTEETNRYHPYRKNETVRMQSPSIKPPSPEEQTIDNLQPQAQV